jgi:hypothetical protein
MKKFITIEDAYKRGCPLNDMRQCATSYCMKWDEETKIITKNVASTHTVSGFTSVVYNDVKEEVLTGRGRCGFGDNHG